MSILSKAIGLLIGLLCLTSLSSAAPYEEVDRWLIETYGLDTTVYEIEHLTDRLFDLDDNTALTVIRPLSIKEPIGLFSVLAQLDYPDGNGETMQVRLRIRKFAEVVVAKDKFDRNDPLDPSALSVERMDITTLREQPLRSVEDLAGLRTTRIIRRGTVLTAGMIEAVPDVEAGNEVDIVYQTGLCTITARGKALEPGYKGDLVRVKNAASGKIINAEIIDHGSVSVNP